MTTAAPAALEKRSEYTSIAQAFATTGTGSIASGLLSAAAVKIVAIAMGAGGVAMLGTLQQVMQAGVTGATLNGQTAVVQGASALGGEERRDFLATAAWMTAAATAIAAAVVAWKAGWIAAAVVMSAAFTFASALLRARGQISGLAAIQVIAGVAYVGAAILTRATIFTRAAIFTRTAGGGALTGMVTIPAAVSMLCAMALLWRDRREIASWFGGRIRAAAAGHFFKISGTMMATSLLATGVLLAVRARITSSAGLAETGMFDAAWNISMNQVTVMLAAMQIYYLPVLARRRARPASSGDGGEARTIRGVMEMAVIASAAVICGIALMRPWMVALLYSRGFEGSARLLAWTLVGDYFKVTSWVLAIPMLAAADMKWFAAADGAVQAVFLAASVAIGEARGAAIGFALSYAANFVICAMYARRRLGFRFGARTGAMWIGGLAMVVAACR